MNTAFNGRRAKNAEQIANASAAPPAVGATSRPKARGSSTNDQEPCSLGRNTDRDETTVGGRLDDAGDAASEETGNMAFGDYASSNSSALIRIKCDWNNPAGPWQLACWEDSS